MRRGIISILSGCFIALSDQSQILNPEQKEEVRSVVLDGIQVVSDEEAGALAGLPASATAKLPVSMQKSRIRGINTALWVVTALIGAGLLFTLFLPGGRMKKAGS
ncbi:hypothetical protein J2128_002244 [Methanomicrobium sp. W14]|uniref:hypothetical protein n=1 Tax=Methanomicrobium sp. W14 TaxID=2817839 RepID=UPI001AE6A3F0|nr:hypothetical protein [Methanomicrobium sp. W14]MBP2134278.1 hypothetical protein [Methanomicrobium sp. W14]